ncbi:MAG: hypothetical protein IPP71_13060 [Bacteroidetes bacterium]|nr:hypothetical protein [Bacteroidota bacterium]
MKSFIIYSSLALLMLAGSCKSQKETPASEPVAVKPKQQPATAPVSTTISATGAHEEVTTPDASKQIENMYRFIVSFISISEGTDRTARPELDGILASWEKKMGKPITYESVAWGREGENDFCFKLNELSAEEQQSFVNEVRTAFKNRSLIQITENEPCMHKR